MDPLVAISLRRNTQVQAALVQYLSSWRARTTLQTQKISSEELQAEKAYSQNSHWIPSQPP